MKTLDVDQVLMIHEAVISATGGAPGVRDVGRIEAALARPFAGFGGVETYPTLEEKAAALIHGLAKGHPFVDGNKRTAIVTGGLFLLLNGYRLIVSEDKLVETIVVVAEGRIDEKELAEWIRHNIQSDD